MSKNQPFIMDHMVILCSNLEQSLAFYHDLLPLLGFQQSRDHIYTNQQGIALDFRQAEKLEQKYERYAPGLNHLGIQAHSLADLETIRDEMNAKGYSMPDIQSFNDGHAIFIPDPDGLRVEIGYLHPKRD